MPISEILNEIDAYLSRLRQARELLLSGRTRAPQKRTRRKRKILVNQAKPASKRQDDKKRPRSDHPVAHLKKVTTGANTSAAVRSAGPNHSAHPEQPAAVKPQYTIPQTLVIQRIPARRRSGSIRSVHHRTAKSALGHKLDESKPAIALAGPVNTKIVVVSAQQVQRERERVAHPEVRPHRMPASGLSGRRAFEALFKDENDPS